MGVLTEYNACVDFAEKCARRILCLVSEYRFVSLLFNRRRIHEHNMCGIYG